MRKKLFSLSVMVAIVVFTLLAPVSVSAFWPFGGQALGVETMSNSSGFFGLLQKMFAKFGSAAPVSTANPQDTSVSGTSGSAGSGGFAPGVGTSVMGIVNPQERLDQAVKDGKITSLQETEILTQLAAIRAKQQELIRLEMAFRDWMKANNISSQIFAPPPRQYPTGQQGGTGEVKPQYYPPPKGYPQGYTQGSGTGGQVLPTYPGYNTQTSQ